ncbi:MAG TPA: insulinase family protein, partial [Sphingomicrobium sp.]|nr:insulinase family protein [Sphingomicrobium sp.]
DPASVLQDSVTRAAIEAHPYGSPMAGYVDDVRNLTAEDAIDYYSSHYAPGNAVLAIVGDFKAPEARLLVERDFADVPARKIALSRLTAELPQSGERRIRLEGAVERRYFLFAYPSPAASSADFPAFMVLQEILSGGSGLNLHQSDWSGTPSASNSLLHGLADDMASFLPPTRQSFLFTISGSIPVDADRDSLEREILGRIAQMADRPVDETRLETAKAAVLRALEDDVQTTEDAAHQLAFFEGVGALDALLEMPERIRGVSSADVERVAGIYLRPQGLTVGWMDPGKAPRSRPGSGDPKASPDRPGKSVATRPAGPPRLRRLAGGLPAIVQDNPLSGSVTVELLLSAPAEGGNQSDGLVSLGAISRSGAAEDLDALVGSAAADALKARRKAQERSGDPATRLEQLIRSQIEKDGKERPRPLAIIVSGNVDEERAFEILERRLGRIAPARLGANSSSLPSRSPAMVREKIDKPFAQGGLAYVVEGPRAGTREALAWQMLLYVLTHDYSGRLGLSAIRDKGIVYYIGSRILTDGTRTWATISTGVDPTSADSMEAELRTELGRLVTSPPTPSEVDAARNHILGRDLSAAQSNDELADRLARQFAETGKLRSHEELRSLLDEIGPADLAAAARSFGKGTIIRLDVASPGG